MTLAFTISGVLLLLLVGADVYLTILDDRPRVGPLGDTLNRSAWRVGITIARRVSRTRRHRILNLIGPLLLPSLIVVYLVFLTFGFGLIYYPRIPALFRVSENFGEPSFWDAIYFSGMTLTTAGFGDITPQTRAMRILAVSESAAGVSLISMTVTYLLTVYSALRQKRAVALSFYHQAGEGANVAGFVAHHFVIDKFVGLEGVLRTAARDLQALLESHIEHPILHYFHTVEVYKSLPRVLFIGLETCAVIRSCIDEEAYPELCRHPEVRTLEASARHVLGEFVRSLSLDADKRKSSAAKFEESRRWEARFVQTLRQLGEAGIATKRDREAGWEEYRANREEWEEPLYRFARHLGYDWDEVTGDRDLDYAADEGKQKPRTQGGGAVGGNEKATI
ncbi:MAG: potassium channel family protein [Acidobacteria bacterium]|nr:potassium channel family protein [Acidobacteriota bacterium]